MFVIVCYVISNKHANYDTPPPPTTPPPPPPPPRNAIYENEIGEIVR